MGSTMYFVPFFFVLNPALILRGPTWEVVLETTTAAFGILLIGAGLQGYLVGVGAADNSSKGIAARILLVVAGIFFAIPGGIVLGLNHLDVTLIAIALAVPAVFLLRGQQKIAVAAEPIGRL